MVPHSTTMACADRLKCVARDISFITRLEVRIKTLSACDGTRNVKFDAYFV